MSTLVRVEPTAVELVGLRAAGPGVTVTMTAEAAMRQARMLDDAFARSGPVRARLPEPPLRLHPASSSGAASGGLHP